MDPFNNDVLFWSGIMRDHAMFQINALPASEAGYIRTSEMYQDFFQSAVDTLCSCQDIQPVLSSLLNGVLCFIEYKKCILNGLLCCSLKINLPPGLITHMIEEAEQFRDLLLARQCAVITPVEMLEKMKIWLADSVGHAAALNSFLDPSEGLMIEKVTEFKEKFGKLFTKASEMKAMTERACECTCSLTLLAEETVEAMEKFLCLLEKIKVLRIQCRLMGMGTLLPLLPDHLIREHCYMISKIKCIILCR